MEAETQNKERKKSGRLTYIVRKIRGVNTLERLFFVQNLEVMTRTGFSLAEALRILSPQIKNTYFRESVEDIQQEVEHGHTLASSMQKYPKIFSELFVHMIEGGEVTGQLENTLKQLVRQLKKQYLLKKKITNALIYPIFILVTMVIVGIAMITFVLPKILILYTSDTIALPLPTRVLLAFTNFMSHNIILIIITFVIALITMILFIRNRETKKFWHKFVLIIPIAKKILINIQLAQFFRTLHALLKTDIPIVKSFLIIAKILKLIPYQEIIYTASQKLKKGITVHESLDQNVKLFPKTVIQMVRIGEESGTLDDISGEIAEFFEEEVDSSMNNLTVIIEPLLMLILGAGVAFIAVAVVMPMYSLVNQI
ncbi:MAG: hypothetical protein A3B74_01570 [Candidatus Kerfeldbacteria bacterium RIFCSPHIGHO2_02_FULL_42_14]|uniref:Type II secretion system protein GspF domain-containing protein n=1 Tax=Candidatus Kerfeldbacteria bacterium RIFCSPHIGHO2_02_FULL_42_14 TaxID=1798540 RepID=A0A1G2ASN8_9BACT|nr:MAG: hypothetical protein A3B74_01570 [Candidatus Kerfeldbacteria bacterium RIFCSPHIGHO2_02_FULL_42_14]OGY82307.1 MAG: hypothetical protein A3E60_03770 [Candidatus Kerfeldbacteria bacterium RIFCSPHIGHO2_12_FULL_42_13]OGY84735.1 MAG: hypothetical protein A3I91_05570 [Candidatus Kerfeldbacteria bacterium RIFCSPLOWO2_02_FULL_42_19]OGY85966.1 MAG: hypothetical protein A3G01_03475 [Candidatus Kerfeldbacteria bacterium RIFCSPLOWO2_12_FULL_43_9]